MVDGASKLRQVARRAPLYEQIYQSIREAISSGAIGPGEVVSEAGIAAHLGVSRTPVREAIKQLVREGLLKVRSDGVAYVPDASPEDVAEVYAIRGVLEGLAAAITARNMDERLAQELSSLVRQSEEALQRGDVQRVFELNTAFHDLLVEASGSDLLRALIDRLRDRLVRYRNWSLRRPDHARISVEEHRTIVELLLKRDCRAVQEFVTAHVHRAGLRVVRERGGDELFASASLAGFLHSVVAPDRMSREG